MKAMGKFINPFTDVGFKRIFGQEINKDLLVDFLNALLEGERQVKDITFLDKEQLPVFEDDRKLIYDVYCTDENDEQFIVEMQNQSHLNFRSRTVYYLSQAIARQGEKGSKWMYDLKAVYGVFFLNFPMPGTKAHKLRTDIVLSDRDTHELFSDKMRYIFIELPSFAKEEDECVNDFERWIYVLKNMDTLKRMPFRARKSVFEKLEEVVTLSSLTRAEREKYDESLKTYRDRLAEMAFAQQEGREKGRAEGLAEGMEKGLAEGMEKGLAEGMEKGYEKAQLKNARGMKAAGISPELIAQITGLTPEAIAEL